MIDNKAQSKDPYKVYWTVKHKTDFKDEFNFLETLLVDCGVPEEDISKFLHPNISMVHDPFLMKNMDKVVDIVHKHMKNGSQVAILVDNDQDGMNSASVLGQFLQKDVKADIPEIKYIFTPGKNHGLKYEHIKNFKKGEIDLLIIPDASITCEEYYQVNRNFPDMDIIIMDHHLVSAEYLDTDTNKWIGLKEAKEILAKNSNGVKSDIYTDHVLSINCQDGEYPNPCLSGGGVVQKFIEAYVDKYPDMFTYSDEIDQDPTKKYLDLVSLAICGDGMDLRPLENRYYIIEGMKKEYQRNPFFNELQDRLSDEMGFGRYIHSALWTLTPKVNGVVRFGKEGKKGVLSEKEQMFYAILGKEEEIEYKPRRKSKNDPEPEVEIHTLAWDAARMAVNVKNRQDTEVRKYFKILQDKIEKDHLDENSVIFVDGSDIVERGETTGLIANKLASTYFRPVVLLRDFDAETYGGSGRGYAKGNIKDLNALLTSFDVTCNGHAMAHGVRLKKKDLPTVIQKCNEAYPLTSLKTVHDCDWQIPARKLKKEYVSEVATNYEIFGGTIPEPTFAITNLVIPAKEINGYGENNQFIRFVYNGIVFTKKYCKAEDFPRMIKKGRTGFGKPTHKVRMNLICQFTLNLWEDKVNPEVKILYFDSQIDNGEEIDGFMGFKDEYEKDALQGSVSDSDGLPFGGIKVPKVDNYTPPEPSESDSKGVIENDNGGEKKVVKKRGRPKKNQTEVSNINMQKVEEEFSLSGLDEENIEKVENKKVEKKIEKVEKKVEKVTSPKPIDKPKKKIYTLDDDIIF